MNIILQSCDNLDQISSYLKFNQVPHTELDLFNNDVDIGGRYTLQNYTDVTNILLIVNFNIFLQLCEGDSSRLELIKFCKNHNQLWVWNDIDGLIASMFYIEQFKKIDDAVVPGSITFFVDGTPIIDYGLKNIDHQIINYSCFFELPRIKNSRVFKQNCSYDFMLTMTKQKLRPHRELLWNELNSRTGLINCGVTHYHEKQNGAWIGEWPTHLDFPEIYQPGPYPSMDLYLDSWLEVVPETLYKDGFFVTEKTIKPIATKTPFLLLSTPGFLDHLKSYGFRTFDHLINEDYNRQEKIEDQTRMLVDTLQDIVKNGSKEFYRASQEVLDYNHEILAGLCGKRLFEIDLFICKHLESVKHKLG